MLNAFVAHRLQNEVEGKNERKTRIDMYHCLLENFNVASLNNEYIIAI